MIASGRYKFAVVQTSAAPSSAVYSALADVDSWHRWMPGVNRAFWETDATGPGAIRTMFARGLKAREQILESTPPHHQGYALLSGLPARDYRGDVWVDDHESGSLIRWEVAFNPKLPGTGPLLRSVMRSSITKVAAALSAESEKRFRQTT